MLRILIFGLIAGTLLGCANQSRSSYAAADYPRVSIEMRAMLAPSGLWEEGLLEVLSNEGRSSPIALLEVSPVSMAINQTDTELLISLVMAFPQGISIISPWLRSNSGDTSRQYFVFDGVFFMDDNARLREPPLVLRVMPDALFPMDGPERVRVSLQGDWIAASMFGEIADWRNILEHEDDQSQVVVRQGVAFDVEFEVDSHQTQLIALPGYVSDRVYADDPDRRKYLMLLIRPTIVHSAEQERVLFPGLDDEEP